MNYVVQSQIQKLSTKISNVDHAQVAILILKIFSKNTLPTSKLIQGVSEWDKNL